MSLIEFIPRGEPDLPVISIGTSAESYSKRGRTPEEKNRGEDLLLFVDGEVWGQIDWELSNDKKVGNIDAIDRADELLARRLRGLAYDVISECMFDSTPRLEHIVFPEAAYEDVASTEVKHSEDLPLAA